MEWKFNIFALTMQVKTKFGPWYIIVCHYHSGLNENAEVIVVIWHHLELYVAQYETI